jgi:hypothetical protein
MGSVFVSMLVELVELTFWDQDQVQDSQVTISEFQGHPTKVVFEAVISFSKKRRNHTGTNQVTMADGRPQP